MGNFKAYTIFNKTLLENVLNFNCKAP